MTAPALTIRRLSVTAHPEGDPERISRLLCGVAEYRLDRALSAVALPPGTWCIRRLDVPVRLDLTRPDPALEAAWAAELVSALLHALSSGSPDVVHYDRDLDAIVDLICGVATGRTEREWVWARIGLLTSSDPPPAREPGAAILAALHRRPELALGAVTTALHRVGLPPLYRVLGPTGWTAVASVVVAATGGDTSLLSQTVSIRVSPLMSSTSTDAIPPASVRPGDQKTELAYGGAEAKLARILVAASYLAATVRHSRLRPPPSTLKTWAVLIIAEADTSVLRRGSARGVVAAVEEVLAHAVGAEWVTSPEPSTESSTEWSPPIVRRGVLAAGDGSRRELDTSDIFWRYDVDIVDFTARAVVRRHTPDELSAVPSAAKPADRIGEPCRHDAAAVDVARVPALAQSDSQWAGLLFLLATAADAGIPDDVLDDPVFASRPLPWVLQGVATCLGLPIADPAVAAFAGVDPHDRPPWQAGLPPTEEEHHRLSAIADRWVAVTAEALDEDDQDPLQVVTVSMRRRGRISYQPGWIEIELSLDQVDVAVRRAGLDLDPGWVPWLGAVVRFIYV